MVEVKIILDGTFLVGTPDEEVARTLVQNLVRKALEGSGIGEYRLGLSSTPIEILKVDEEGTRKD